MGIRCVLTVALSSRLIKEPFTLQQPVPVQQDKPAKIQEATSAPQQLLFSGHGQNLHFVQTVTMADGERHSQTTCSIRPVGPNINFHGLVNASSCAYTRRLECQ